MLAQGFAMVDEQYAAPAGVPENRSSCMTSGELRGAGEASTAEQLRIAVSRMRVEAFKMTMSEEKLNKFRVKRGGLKSER